MVKIEEHLKKIEDMKKQAENSKGNQKKQYTKCYHKLCKQLLQCYINLNPEEKIKYIEIMKR